MLRIAVPSNTTTGLTFTSFEHYQMPAPPCGVDPEINDDLILNFEDEQEAVTYADQLAYLSDGLHDKSSPQNLAIGEIILAIRNDKFVQNYSQTN